MEIVEEELNVYAVCNYVDNPYFLSVEYPTLRHNLPDSFLPLQVRDQDGKRTLYYEITGKSSLIDRGAHESFTYQECFLIINGMYLLYEDLEKYMLSFHQVSFRREDIYTDVNGHLQWMYLSGVREDTHKDIVDLFLWILSMVSYEDKKALDMIYQIFNHIKKDMISKDFLAEVLGYTKESDQKLKASSPDSDWQEELDFPLFEENEVFNQNEGYKKSGKSHDVKRILKNIFLGIVFVIVLLASGYVGYCIYLRGITPFLVVCFSITVGLLSIILRFIATAIMGRKHSSEKKEEHGEIHEISDIQKEEYGSYSDKKSIFEELEDHWETGDETMLISNVQTFSNPIMCSEESGESLEIKVFPFYIGSENGMNQMALHNKAVSRQHAVILKGEGDQYFLEDLNSKNGTKVDGMKVIPEKRAVLRNGSRIVFANEAWIFSCEH